MGQISYWWVYVKTGAAERHTATLTYPTEGAANDMAERFRSQGTPCFVKRQYTDQFNYIVENVDTGEVYDFFLTEEDAHIAIQLLKDSDPDKTFNIALTAK